MCTSFPIVSPSCKEFDNRERDQTSSRKPVPRDFQNGAIKRGVFLWSPVAFAEAIKINNWNISGQVSARASPPVHHRSSWWSWRCWFSRRVREDKLHRHYGRRCVHHVVAATLQRRSCCRCIATCFRVYPPFACTSWKRWWVLLDTRRGDVKLIVLTCILAVSILFSSQIAKFVPFCSKLLVYFNLFNSFILLRLCRCEILKILFRLVSRASTLVVLIFFFHCSRISKNIEKTL